MQNLEQIRAENALAAAGRTEPPPGKPKPTVVDENAVTKLPALVVNNGLLAAAAFAEKKGAKLRDAMDAVARHLADPRINRLPDHCQDTPALLKHLSSGSSDKLRLAAEEALAYLSFLKRFAKKSE